MTCKDCAKYRLCRAVIEAMGYTITEARFDVHIHCKEFKQREGDLMQIIDCKAIRDEILNNIPAAMLKGKAMLVISRPEGGNASYLRSIAKMAERYDVDIYHERCSYTPTGEDVAAIMGKVIERRGEMYGLPALLLLGFTPEERAVIARRNYGIMEGVKLLDPPYFPNVVDAVERVLFKTLGDRMTEPLHTVVIGRSELAVKTGTRLLKKGHTVTYVHTGTDDLKAYTRKADVIVSFAGCPNLIKGDMVKDDAVIVSVGCGTLEGRLCGDIDMESMKDKNVLVTPTPGGVGIITTALLFEDLAR